jgi:hypothetical protein
VCRRSLLTGQRACPAESVGVELAHRFAAEEQRHFLKAGPVAIGTGGKYGRPRALRATSAEAKPIG